jgi:hypothetical protein
MMEPSEAKNTHESNQSLWLLIASPTMWALHFLACYLTAAIWCAKFAGPDRALGMVRGVIAVYTVLALIGIGLTGFIGYRRHRFQHRSTTHDQDTAEDRHRMLGYATLLLSGLSAIATLFVALAAYFIEKCH